MALYASGTEGRGTSRAVKIKADLGEVCFIILIISTLIGHCDYSESLVYLASPGFNLQPYVNKARCTPTRTHGEELSKPAAAVSAGGGEAVIQAFNRPAVSQCHTPLWPQTPHPPAFEAICLDPLAIQWQLVGERDPFLTKIP
ncbi:hypothetical protein P4O66_007268 [Electrophorus voltai]|uniref:Uncharacterized protein n=1 Tax=Electrophorus voltai TaxID=2609070 RepID=A0AAD8ZJ26_9TELE|nr:hypothetical protein P4O66_007268 [Electrophorus voltai]